MDFKEAYETIVLRSVEKNTVEIPTILSCLDFENKECLELGAGPFGRIAISLAGFVKHITCLERDPDNVSKIMGEAGYKNVEKKVSALYYKFDKEKIPFPDARFDVVYFTWPPHKTIIDPKFLDEMMRVSKKHILILMPGIKGDEPKLVSLARKGEKERRMQYKGRITRFLIAKGWKIDDNFRERTIKLEFANEKEIQGVFNCLAFKNESLPLKVRQKVDSFLKKRMKNFKDGFYIIHAVRI